MIAKKKIKKPKKELFKKEEVELEQLEQDLPAMEAVDEKEPGSGEEESETVTKFKSNIGHMSIPFKTKLKYVLLSVIIGALIGCLGATMYYQNLSKQEKQRVANEEQKRKGQTAEERIKEIARINIDEKPIVAVIKDASIIESIPLYQFAKNGDKVLAYQDRTVVYDEATNQIVSLVPQKLLENNGNISQIMEGEAQPAPEGAEPPKEESEAGSAEEETPAEEQPTVNPRDINVEVRNGTKTAGLAGQVAKEIETAFGYSVNAANASKQDYKETLIIDLAQGVYADAISKLREKYNISSVLTEMPEGETTPEADIVLIIVR